MSGVHGGKLAMCSVSQRMMNAFWISVSKVEGINSCDFKGAVALYKELEVALSLPLHVLIPNPHTPIFCGEC